MVNKSTQHKSALIKTFIIKKNTFTAYNLRFQITKFKASIGNKNKRHRAENYRTNSIMKEQNKALAILIKREKN